MHWQRSVGLTQGKICRTKLGRAVCLTVFCNPQRNSRNPVFGFRLLGVKRAICKVLDNNKRSSENRFSDDLFVFYLSTMVCIGMGGYLSRMSEEILQRAPHVNSRRQLILNSTFLSFIKTKGINPMPF
ncbi:hypothetical protein HMPREF3156_02018 [Neisseria sp. HMSC06F02]|nr:hypothetical protein HMPREF3156_02018 [Neisseria sp. HMSC06F02]